MEIRRRLLALLAVVASEGDEWLVESFPIYQAP